MMAPEQRRQYETLLRHARGMIGAIEGLLAADVAATKPQSFENTGTHDASRRNVEETPCQKPQAAFSR